MDIVAKLIEIAAGFIPMFVVVAILLTLFWAATKLFPSLGEWMRSTDGMPEAEHENKSRTETTTAPYRETRFDNYL
jgi:hypothetical protein